MADVRGSCGTCNERCGCPSPCPGGISCRCASSDASMEHKRCSCGEHCGCNPCTCPKSEAATGKANCKCGPGCACPTCAA
ncbi:metallothionein-like protein 4B [Solanum tuberosum]|uniref:metallothionein-like protein 4B n=1 Tax=Solanum tuberosum TaxID=4113 RepID=UPI0003D27865|nr:PREDICTED: metallothionein-like protein 4B [Solanum tuberosum]